LQLSGWIEQLSDKETMSQTIFHFIDPNMKFRLLKRRRAETMRFIYHAENKDIYSWEMILNVKNVTEFKGQIEKLLIQFPIR
jgi:ubiquitin-protein ligase